MEVVAVEYSQLQDFKKFGKGLLPSEHEEIYRTMRSLKSHSIKSITSKTMRTVPLAFIANFGQ